VRPAGPRKFRSSRALLVRSVDVGESDRRVSFFTEGYGLLIMVGKAARRSARRFGGTLQKYLLLEVGWTEVTGRMPVLGSSVLIESFWSIVEDWERVRHADYLLELTAALFPQAGSKRTVFGVLLSGLRALAAGDPPSMVARKAEVSYLSIGGWGPDLSACKRCGRSVETFLKTGRWTLGFLPSEGGLLCGACRGTAGVPLSPGAVKTWQILQASSPSVRERIRISETILVELQSVIRQYLEFNMGFAVRGATGSPSGEKS
jgi:DNA repair protein RecO (recombination protein O)